MVNILILKTVHVDAKKIYCAFSPHHFLCKEELKPLKDTHIDTKPNSKNSIRKY